MVSEPRRARARQAHREPRRGQRRGVRDLEHAGGGFAVGLALAEAEAPDAVARDALQLRIVDVAQNEGDIEVVLRKIFFVEPAGRAMQHLLAEVVLIAAGSGPRPSPSLAWRVYGKLDRWAFGKGVDHPARLAARAGEDADAQLARARSRRKGLSALSRDYKRQTRRPSRFSALASSTDLISITQPLRTTFLIRSSRASSR